VNGWFSRSYCIDQKGGESIEHFRETFVITKTDVAVDAVNIKMLACVGHYTSPFYFTIANGKYEDIRDMPNFPVQTRSYVRVPQTELWSHLQKIVKKIQRWKRYLIYCRAMK